MQAAQGGAWATVTLEAFLVDRWWPAGPVGAEAAAEAELGCASAALAGLAKWPGGTLRFDCG